jgi:tRNA-modifying protein YgfZ
MIEFMTTWRQFLIQQGARTSDTAIPDIIDFGHSCSHEALLGGFVAPLTDLGTIAVSGEDAASFLHNQLTNDVEHLTPQAARLAGYCSPKGRLLATLLVWRSVDTIFLQLPADIQAAIQKRLQMFVLRAKAKLTDITVEQAILGLGGKHVAEVLQEWFPNLPSAPSAPYSTTTSDAGTLIRMTDANDTPRYQWITSQNIAQNVWSALTARLTPVGSSVWHLTDINTGIPQVTQLTQEQFVPQMINFELIGGINFKKGCYPGQEIVARSQYLGKLKRRMLLASINTTDVQAGQEVFSSTDPQQPCGLIVNAESNLQGAVDCLVEIKVASVEAGSVHLGSADGAVLVFKPLPYAFPDPA